MRKISPIVSEFKKKIQERFSISEVILFGSQAKSKPEEGSDIDVLVILQGKVDMELKEAIYDIAYEIGLEYDVVLDVSVYSKEDWERYKGVLPFLVNIEREGIII